MKITGLVLTNEDAADIVHGAIEGGTGYWAECRNYNWQDWYEKDEERSTERYTREKIKDLPYDYVFVEIMEDEDAIGEDVPDKKWFQLTRGVLERGVIGLIENYPHLIHGVSNRGNGDIECDFDATSCDVIVQLAVFGKVVYG